MNTVTKIYGGSHSGGRKGGGDDNGGYGGGHGGDDSNGGARGRKPAEGIRDNLKKGRCCTVAVMKSAVEVRQWFIRWRWGWRRDGIWQQR